jgi:hypothetical protein
MSPEKLFYTKRHDYCVHCIENKVYLHYEELENHLSHPFYNGSGLFILRRTEKV